MLDVSKRFVQVADVITNKIAELLYAPVFVTNERGMVVTSSEPQQIGSTLSWEHSHNTLANCLRIPLQHETETGEVIVGKPINQESISPRLAQALVELVIHQTTTQYQLISQHDLKNQLINDLVHGRIWNEAIILEQAKYLGIDLSPPRAVILIDATDYILQGDYDADQALAEVKKKRRTQAVIKSIVSFFHLPNDTICTDLGEAKVCVLKASDSKNLDRWANGDDVCKGLGSSWANLTALKRAADALLSRLCDDMGTVINIGIGRYHPGIQGLARSYEDARAALCLGRRFLGQNRVHCLGELGIAAFVGVADESTKIDLAKYLLSPLDHEPELLTTLDIFFGESCCSSATAKRLSIHRNTLSYRLDKIALLTGLEPRQFDDAVQMRVALLLRSLQPMFSGT